MFYKMIANKQEEWYRSSDCTVNSLIEYIVAKNKMRDAQIEAIKTYLFLKIHCLNKPLHKLFTEGYFNSINIDDLELKGSTKKFLCENKAAVALLEYASLKDETGTVLSQKLIDKIKSSPEELDYSKIFFDLFYSISYSDYLFSLPMGAGKTYLMASFIYLDLYFATTEPKNKSFAHNFIIFAPSGLKTSVVPSLRTIQHFDPSWIIPEPAASKLKKLIKFEVLDQNKAKKNSNKTKNPNVQKIANHQPLHELIGLVAVTNAEKVILDRIKESDGQINFLEDSEDDKDKQANELRNLIGKLPNLAVFVDEVHHAATDDKKLRAVITKWTAPFNFARIDFNNIRFGSTVTNVIGFSGTPYLQKAEKISVADKLMLSTLEISNVVYYYPLVKGVNNFLKKPKIMDSSSNNRLNIIEAGVREFIKTYKNTVYFDGTLAKLGIYCGKIETLEEIVYPLVERLCVEYDLNPSETILKFHGGNKQYPIPIDSALEFESLDKSFSKKRIVLLVQIGKEGWDCKSLTGIILSAEGDCSTNMVLQTTCRCLRQVERGKQETALIYLNEANAKILDKQLKQQHHINIKEFETGNTSNSTTINRYDRTQYLKLPPVDFYQLKINYQTSIVQIADNPATEISSATDSSEYQSEIIREREISSNLATVKTEVITKETGDVVASFNNWLYSIVKNSMGFLSVPQLKCYTAELQDVFNKITYQKDGLRYFSSKVNLSLVEANVRKAFCDKRSFNCVEEVIPERASLLKLDNFTYQVQTSNPQIFYPAQEVVENIIKDDAGKLKIDAKTAEAIKLLTETGNTELAENLRLQKNSHPIKDNSFHYIPYKTDSDLEQLFLDEVLSLSDIKSKGLELYYNGDRALTEFKVKCYKKQGQKTTYLGMYTPDFLIIKRKGGAIHKVIIVETKGRIYATDPTFKDKRKFMETLFKDTNNLKFGYEKFEYLYLDDSLEKNDIVDKTTRVISDFFGEN